MPRARRLPSAGLVVAILAIVYGACGPPLRGDEFLCEEAYVHLKECCPGFSAGSDYCTYQSDCFGNQRSPALTEQEGDCIRKLTCAELAAAGTCERAQQRASADPGLDDRLGEPSSSGRNPPWVCR